MSEFAFDRLREKHPEAISERYSDRSGAPWVVIAAAHIPHVLSTLKNDPDMQLGLSAMPQLRTADCKNP